jgi:molybdopterin-guanine dinucleotide biosynthesis protein MobB
MHELRDEAEPDSHDLMQKMSPVDLLIIEGWKAKGHEKIEIHRPAHGKPLIQPDDPKIVAVASDVDLPGLPVPRLDLNDVEGIADFIVARCGLAARVHAAE